MLSSTRGYFLLSPTTSNLGRYTAEEVEAVVEGYEELRALRYKPGIHVRLMDVEQALKRLSIPHRQAVLLVGMHGLAERTAGRLIGASQPTMSRRYTRGLAEIVNYLNGRTHERNVLRS